MEEKIYNINNARLTFTSFIKFMIVAGIVIAVVPLIFNILFATWRFFAGDPDISAVDFYKPLISLVLTPVEAFISGIILYPIYKKIFTKKINLNLKICGSEKPLIG